MDEADTASPEVAPVPPWTALGSLAGVVSGVAAGLLLLHGLAVSCEGVLWTTSSQRIHHWVEAKRAAAVAVPSPRIIVLGGSNAFYGIRAEQLGEELGIPVVNCATHGGLPSGFLFHEARSLVRPGDLVLYVPEYVHFFIHPSRANTETLAFLLGSGRDFLEDLPPEDYIQILMTAPVDELFAPLFRNRSEWQERTREVAEEYREVISPLGDYLKNRPEDRGERERKLMGSIRHIATITRPGIAVPGPESADYLHCLSKFRDSLESRGARLFFTWPNTVHFPQYDGKGAGEFLEKVRIFLEGEGIPVVGDARDAMRPREEFFDSIYHLDSEGARNRTRKLAADLRSTLEGAGIPLPPVPR